MAAVDSQQTYMPYDPAKDCSQGFCSIYCPQWCYMIFPPPPPFEFDDGSGGSSSSSFSPLVIAIIGILASAFLLVTYYTIISKYCGSFDSLRRRLHHGSTSDDEQGGAGGVRHQEAWHVALSDGLEDSVIKSISVCKYKKGDGFVDGTDCSVCLNEFKDDESLRLLPKCSHAFHIQCIDTWLKSHSNCPLCRSVIVTPSPAATASPPAPVSPPHPLQERDRPSPQIHHGNEAAAALEEDLGERGRREVGGDSGSKELGGSERGGVVLEIRAEGSVSAIETDHGGGARLSIADVLEMGMGEDPDGNPGDGSSSDRGGGGGETGKVRKSGGSDSVMSSVPMKRSFSSGRFSFPRNGRSSNSVLPM